MLLANTKDTPVTLTKNLIIGVHVLTVDETDITIPIQSDIPQKLQQSSNKSFMQKRVQGETTNKRKYKHHIHGMCSKTKAQANNTVGDR